MQTFTLTFEQLKALSLSMAKLDVRYYLNGVYLHTKDGKAMAVSTDGHRILTVELKDNEVQCDAKVLIQDNFVKDLLKLKLKQYFIVVTKDGDKTQWQCAHIKTECGLNNSNYPDYVRIMITPEKDDMFANTNFNCEYLVDARNQKDLLESEKVKKFGGILLKCKDSNGMGYYYNDDIGFKIGIMPQRM